MNSSSYNKCKMDEIPPKPKRRQRVRKEKDLGSDFISSQAIVFLVKGSRK